MDSVNSILNSILKSTVDKLSEDAESMINIVRSVKSELPTDNYISKVLVLKETLKELYDIPINELVNIFKYYYNTLNLEDKIDNTVCLCLSGLLLNKSGNSFTQLFQKPIDCTNLISLPQTQAKLDTPLQGELETHLSVVLENQIE